MYFVFTLGKMLTTRGVAVDGNFQHMIGGFREERARRDALANATGQRTLSYASRRTPCSLVNGREGVPVAEAAAAVRRSVG